MIINNKQHSYFSWVVKGISTVFLFLLTVTVYAQQYNTTIQGNIPQMKPGIKVHYVWNDKEHMKSYENWDYVLSTAEGFTIKLNVDEGGGNELIVLIGDKVAAGKLLFIYADKGIVTISAKDSLFTDVALSGNAGAKELNQFHQFLASSPELTNYESIKNDAYQAAVKKDPAAIQVTGGQLKKADSIRKIMAIRWINEHPNSPVCAFIMHSPLEPFGGRLTDEEKKAMLDKMTLYARNNKIATDMLYALTNKKMLEVGQAAPDFTQNDTLGKPVSLKSFRGKYVLLDFWASWCVPCRAENPNVVKAYNKFKNKGFTVLSVSLDQPGKKEAWLKAIHTDHLTWTHVSDLKFWGNAVVKLYDINAVPANFLIGPDGVILAKDLKGEELEITLAKYLKN
ncbi:MAG: Peroxiredoxin [Mucilaginibacter sp.]|nr:Peroxiredoxin [Mucilaginibacter sp.]